MELFWQRATAWTYQNIGIKPSLGLKVNGLFGQEKEKPDDLFNIFYRTGRYAIYCNRKCALGPRIEAFEELLVDELDRKYKNDRWRKYEDEPSEFKAITWLERRRD